MSKHIFNNNLADFNITSEECIKSLYQATYVIVKYIGYKFQKKIFNITQNGIL